MKRIVVLGSTGSIGTQTLDVCARHPERLQVVGLVARRNAGELANQAARHPHATAILVEGDPHGPFPTGMDRVVELVTQDDVDLVVVSVAGVIGLEPTVAAIQAGKHIALASKEVLVAAGEWVMPLIAQHGVELTPIDSEHSAIFQCLRGYATEDVARIVLTASGGPFRGWSLEQLGAVTPAMALKHPNWTMGGKITVDSATLMNKGLELIEAKWLFGLELDQVDLVVHPQSIVHSFVELVDGSVLAQLGWPDMRLPIQVALLHPDRVDGGLEPWDPLRLSQLTFESHDATVFRGPDLARAAANAGGTMPCAFNAANEAAVQAFLEGKLDFLGIQTVVEYVMNAHVPTSVTMESLLETDRWARAKVQESCSRALPRHT